MPTKSVSLPKKRKSTTYRQFILLKLKQKLRSKKPSCNSKFNIVQRTKKFFKKFINFIKF